MSADAATMGPVIEALVEALRELGRRAPELVSGVQRWLGGEGDAHEFLDQLVARLLGTFATLERGGWQELDDLSSALAAWAIGTTPTNDSPVGELLGRIQSLASDVGVIVAGVWQGDRVDPGVEAFVRAGFERLSAMCLDVALGDLKRRA